MRSIKIDNLETKVQIDQNEVVSGVVNGLSANGFQLLMNEQRLSEIIHNTLSDIFQEVSQDENPVENEFHPPVQTEPIKSFTLKNKTCFDAWLFYCVGGRCGNELVPPLKTLRSSDFNGKERKRFNACMLFMKEIEQACRTMGL